MQMRQSQTPALTILLAEDDVLVRMSLAEFLRGCGHKVLEARSADEAIELLEGGFSVDVVVSNVALAGDGFGLAKWIRDHGQQLDFRLMGTTKRAVEIAASLCASGPLPAPFDPQILERRILRLLAGRRQRPQEGKRIAVSGTSWRG
ncbi:response regulator [Bradyrhizobium sp. USDA 4353]